MIYEKGKLSMKKKYRLLALVSLVPLLVGAGFLFWGQDSLQRNIGLILLIGTMIFVMIIVSKTLKTPLER
jgi:hypothetical protein